MFPPFPEATAEPPPLDAALRARGLSLRRAVPADLDFLRRLYASFRAPELALVAWDAGTRRAFVEDQFRLQHLHFTRFYARADFWIIEQAGALPIGRLYLDRSTRPWLIVDIGLVPEARGQGLGRAVLEWIQQRAGPAGVALSVAANNPRAEALYRRLGFVDDGEAGEAHRAMRWAPS